jgi:hypothetical protein
LRDHYGISGKNLQKRIENADRFLPASANAAALDRLRKLANAVLHSKERDEPLLTLENAQLEKDMVSLLYVLRGLIEDAPPAPPSTRS